MIKSLLIKIIMKLSHNSASLPSLSLLPLSQRHFGLFFRCIICLVVFRFYSISSMLLKSEQQWFVWTERIQDNQMNKTWEGIQCMHQVKCYCKTLSLMIKILSNIRNNDNLRQYFSILEFNETWVLFPMDSKEINEQ